VHRDTKLHLEPEAGAGAYVVLRVGLCIGLRVGHVSYHKLGKT